LVPDPRAPYVHQGSGEIMTTQTTTPTEFHRDLPTWAGICTPGWQGLDCSARRLLRPMCGRTATAPTSVGT